MRALRAAAPLAALALVALPPAAASGGTVSAGLALTFTAAPGEANQLTIARSGDRIVFGDVVPIAEGTPTCEGDGTLTVTCATAPAPARVEAVLGDGDDRATVGAIGGALPAALDGGSGDDRLDAAAATGFVAALGGPGRDVLLAGTGESDLTGGDGDDVLAGGPDGAFTTFLGGAAPDGADTLIGGVGVDVAGYAARTAPVALSVNGLADDGEAGERDDIGAAVERLEGGAGADVLAAGPLDSELTGGAGADRLTGGPAHDLLGGGEGDDALAGGAGDDIAGPTDAVSLPGDDVAAPGESNGIDAGADAFAGGDGFDTMSYAARTAPVAASPDGVANDGEANERDDIGADVEALTGGRGADTLSGSRQPEQFTGGAGADAIEPRGGLDEVRAGDGDDTVRAQDGTADWVSCGAGIDTLAGDATDVVVSCEHATLAPVPAGRDARGPRVRIDGLPARPRFRHVRRGLRPRVRVDEPARYVVELLIAVARLDARAARAPYNLTLARRTIRTRSATTRRVTLRPKRELLGRRRKLRVRIRVTATDTAGNVRVARRSFKARR